MTTEEYNGRLASLFGLLLARADAVCRDESTWVDSSLAGQPEVAAAEVLGESVARLADAVRQGESFLREAARSTAAEREGAPKDRAPSVSEQSMEPSQTKILGGI